MSVYKQADTITKNEMPLFQTKIDHVPCKNKTGEIGSIA